MTEYAICCDWGSSSLRIRLVSVGDSHIVDQQISEQGIAFVHEQWQGQLKKNSRIEFYLSFLTPHILTLANRNNQSLHGIPVIISGMASSNIGIIELPYAEVPFHLDGRSAGIKYLEQLPTFNHRVAIISGLKNGQEVMRGEETQLIGLGGQWATLNGEQEIVVILPGTHSKHVHVCQGSILSFNTFITGELFDILSHYGMLKDAVACPEDKLMVDWAAFQEGVQAAVSTELLHALFQVRTNKLFAKFDAEQNYAYLSGLLIGYELRGLVQQGAIKILLCCEPRLFSHYQHAIQVLNLEGRTQFIAPFDARQATISGQLASAYSSLIKLTNA